MKDEKSNHALFARVLARRGNRRLENVATMALGVFLLTALAQISFRLPWTVVPITGQTFGVVFVSLLLGRARAAASVASYLFLGMAGVPVFAGLRYGLSLSPTLGSLIGMFFSSIVVGTLADRGWSKSFVTAWAAATLGSLTTFACGLAILSHYVPRSELLGAGFLPFLPGDLIKNVSASLLVSRANREVQK